MKYDYSKGIFGNIETLFNQRNVMTGRIDSTDYDLSQTNSTVAENQAENDELMLDHEERLILLEVGE